MSGEYRFLSTPSEMSGLRCFARNFRKLKIYSKKLSKRHLQNYFNGKQYKVIQRRRQDFFGGGGRQGHLKAIPHPKMETKFHILKPIKLKMNPFFKNVFIFQA